MKKSILYGLIVSMSAIYTSCETLPDTNGGEPLNSNYYQIGDVLFTTQNMAVLDPYSSPPAENVQYSTDRNFSTGVKMGEYSSSQFTQCVFTNLTPSTTYYYRYVEKDALGGAKYTEPKSFTTKDQNYELLTLSLTTDQPVSVHTTSDGYDQITVELDYSIQVNVPEQARDLYFRRFNARIYYQLQSEGNITATQDIRDTYAENYVNFSLWFSNKRYDVMTYWVVVYNDYDSSGSTSSDRILYQSEKRTLILDGPSY